MKRLHSKTIMGLFCEECDIPALPAKADIGNLISISFMLCLYHATYNTELHILLRYKRMPSS